jgi:hypothetical protein
MVSNEVKLNQTIAELEKVNAYSTFSDKRNAAFKENGGYLPIAKTLELAESVLATATRTVTKHNGREDNGWQPIAESASDDPRELQVKGYMLTCNISEADARKVLGLAPKGLIRRQACEYQLLKSSGFSEADAERLAKEV